MCGPHRRSAPLRRIPQAVGAIATVDFSGQLSMNSN